MSASRPSSEISGWTMNVVSNSRMGVLLTDGPLWARAPGLVGTLSGSERTQREPRWFANGLPG